jgi:DNA invertase Pin-like site-specific DNA recombinase
MTERQRAAIYTRISRDPEGERLGVDRQRADLDRHAAKLGLEVVQRFEDNDIGASTRSTKARPAYNAMLAAARDGQFDVILAYTSSRLTRRPRENEDLIELAERHKIEFKYKNSPSFDLNTADGRNIARILAANDAAESERIAERVKRASQQRAEQGGFHGGRPAFGFEAVLDDTGKVKAWRHHPQHAAWLREAAKRLLAGESMYSLCADWNAKGRTTGNGAIWRSRAIKRMITSPAVAGYREYDGQLVKATQWKPILDEKTWQKLRALLGDDMHQPRPFPTGKTARKYALSGFVRCGKCGQVMSSMTATKAGPPSFYCNPAATGGCGGTRIAMEPLELYIYERLIDYIDSDAFRAKLAANAGGDEDDSHSEQELRDSIEQDRQRLHDLDDQHTDGDLDDARWRRQVQRLSERIQSHETELAELTRRAARSNTPDLRSVRRGWERRQENNKQNNAWKRDVLSMFIDKVMIQPYPDGMPVTLTRRRGESDESLAERRAELVATALRVRVKVSWRS